MQKIQTDHWGLHELDGVKFFLEPNMDNDVCPFGFPRGLPCPHMGLGEYNYKKWHKSAYVVDETLTSNKCQKLIPNSLETVQGLTFLHARYLPRKERLLQMLNMTNALPLFIYGIDERINFWDLLTFVQMDPVRPIYFSGNSYVPVPKNIKIIGGKNE